MKRYSRIATKIGLAILAGCISLATLASCVNPGSTPTDPPESRPTSIPTSPSSDGQQTGSSTKSDKTRVTSPDVPAADQAALVAGNSAFALDLYHQLKESDGNLFYSPYSISLALAMAHAGARGETERQMAETLHYTLPQESLHPAFNWLDLALAGRGEGAAGKDGEGFRLHIANATWGQEGYTFLSDYLDTLALNYGAGLRLLDFASDPEASRVTINDWVLDQTEGRIEDLLPQGSIDSLTRLVLTNAIYFNAAWATSFDENLTTDGTFHLLDGSEVSVPMMQQTTHLGYASGDGFQAVELPYDGREISMLILLPDEGTYASFEDALTAEQVDTILGSVGYQEVNLTMPKFELESEISLAQTLAAMGMPDVFDPRVADLSGINGRRDLFVTGVYHKAFVLVDEAGTEAAAATGVVVGLTSVGPEPIQVTVDRPFFFLIRDIETGTILFIGRVVNPS